MRIVITGADGFIGRNLAARLREDGYDDVVGIDQRSGTDGLRRAIEGASFVFHLAGVNRPTDPSEFVEGNLGFTETVARFLDEAGCGAPVVLSSSTQAALGNPYGESKRLAEEVLLSHAERTGAPVYLFRLSNVFGKWARPNYNSVVATFCHNIARSLGITINDPMAALRLVYIDDVVEAFVRLLGESGTPSGYLEVEPVYETTVGELARTIQEFAASRQTLTTARVGTGLVRALYSTYLSYLPPELFVYQVPRHGDPRGIFVEMLKTPDCGQFSYFTARPGVTRGEHYHHSKAEKFLVIKGTAHFGFRHIVSGECYDLVVRGGEGSIVETAPGWTHNVTNVGDNELIVMLWANEVFNPGKPDTHPMKVKT